MKASLLSIGTLAAAVALFAGLNSALAANHTASRGVTVASVTSGLGRILVKSACSGQCAGYWPPLITSGKPRAGAAVKASLLGTTKRSDGRLQATYNHHPLYTFVKDTKKGQTTGEGLNIFGAEWYALSPTGSKVERPGGASSAGDPSPGGYGY